MNIQLPKQTDNLSVSSSSPKFTTSLVLYTFLYIELYNVFAKILELDPAPNNGTVGALNQILHPDYKLPIEKIVNTDKTFPQNGSLNSQTVCPQCDDPWTIFARDVDELNAQLYLPHEIEERLALDQHLPFGINAPNSKMFVQKVLVKNFRMKGELAGLREFRVKVEI